MNFYNKYVLCTLLYSLPFYIDSMEYNDIANFVSGTKVKEIYYSDKELEHLNTIDLNSSPANDDYTTEDESETTETVESVLKNKILPEEFLNTVSTHQNLNPLIFAVEEELYFNYFNNNVQPIISKERYNRENIVKIAKNHKIPIEESLAKYDNTLFLRLKQKDMALIINLSKKHQITIEEAVKHFLNN